MADRAGQQFGSYRLVRRLGGGGFAEVYLGQHVRVSTQQAAIKILHLADVDEQQFQQEAERTAGLKHSHIVRLYDFDIQQELPFLVLEYAPHGSLARHRGQRLSLDTILSYVTQIASALQYAHDCEVIHRDIKPDNILVGSQRELLISDFGIAVISRTGRTSIQSSYNTGGTPYYMAPEMFRGRPEKASDQYSLAIMVYEWLCGRRPFTEGDFIQLGFQHTYEAVPSVRDLVPTIPAAIEGVVITALAKDPHQRFGSVRAFATALAQASQLPSIMVIPSRQEQASELPSTEFAPPRQEQASQLPPTEIMPSRQEQASELPPTEAASFRQEQASELPLKEIVPPPLPEQPPSRQRTISRRTALISLGVAGLAVFGGGITWLALSQKPGYTSITYTGHSGIVNAVDWSPDGKHIASGSADHTVQVWDSSTGQTSVTCTGHSDVVNAVAWSPDGKHIASGSSDKTVKIWNAL